MVVDEIFETELLFSEKIGAVVRLHSTSQLKTPNFINKQGITGTQIVEFITDVEMIKYEE